MIENLKDKKLNIVVRCMACIYAAILFYLNFKRIFDEALWLDEAFTANLIRKSVIGGLKMTANDVHPPLYYLMAKAFCVIFGERGVTLHFVSIIPLAILVVFSLTIIWQKYGACVALIFITLTSISDAAVRFNVEIRMYSWAALFVFFSYYYFYQIINENRKKDYVLFSFFSLAAAYTHYYALIAVAFFYAVLFFRCLFARRDDIKRVLVIIGVAVVVYLPWLFVLIKSLTARVDNYWIVEHSSFGECFNYIFSDKFSTFAWMVVAALTVVAVVYMIKAHDEMSTILFLATGMISVVGTMAVGIGISALLSPFFVTRYIYVASPIAWLVFGIIISKQKDNWLWTGIFVVYFIYVFIPSYKSIYYEDIDIANRTDFIRNIVAGLDEDDVIVTNFEDSTIPNYYFYGHEYETVVNVEDLTIDNDGKNYWLIVSDDWSLDGINTTLSEQGFGCKTVLDYGLLGHTKILVYNCYEL